MVFGFFVSAQRIQVAFMMSTTDKVAKRIKRETLNPAVPAAPMHALQTLTIMRLEQLFVTSPRAIVFPATTIIGAWYVEERELTNFQLKRNVNSRKYTTKLHLCLKVKALHVPSHLR